MNRLSVIKKYWKEILGTAGNWFLFDVLFYGNSLFYPTVLEALGLDSGDTPHEKLFNSTKLSLAVTAMAIPGYWVSVLLIDK